jgi:hypothetical protein
MPLFFKHFLALAICTYPSPFATIPQIVVENFVGLGGKFSIAEDSETSSPNPQMVGEIHAAPAQ